MSKEHAYAYEAGYRDGSINYELEHCPACKNVADLQDALDENAKLRQELEFKEASERKNEFCCGGELMSDFKKLTAYKSCSVEYVSVVGTSYVDQLKAENDKLRQELAIREASEQEKTIEYLRQENIDWEDKYRALAAENAKLRENMSKFSDHKQDDLLTEYGTATTAYILMALSIESLGRRNEQLTADNAKLRKSAAHAWRLFTEKGAVHPSDLTEVDAVREELRELGVEVSK